MRKRNMHILAAVAVAIILGILSGRSLGGDAAFYFGMAAGLRVPAPYAARIGVPLVAALLPWGRPSAFAAVHAAALLALALVTARQARTPLAAAVVILASRGPWRHWWGNPGTLEPELLLCLGLWVALLRRPARQAGQYALALAIVSAVVRDVAGLPLAWALLLPPRGWTRREVASPVGIWALSLLAVRYGYPGSGGPALLTSIGVWWAGKPWEAWGAGLAVGAVPLLACVQWRRVPGWALGSVATVLVASRVAGSDTARIGWWCAPLVLPWLDVRGLHGWVVLGWLALPWGPVDRVWAPGTEEALRWGARVPALQWALCVAQSAFLIQLPIRSTYRVWVMSPSTAKCNSQSESVGRMQST